MRSGALARQFLFTWLLSAACVHGPTPLPPVRLLAVRITPVAPTLAQGTRVQLTCTGSYSDGTVRELTGEAKWTSGNPAVATVSAGGEVSAGKAGAVEITASAEGVGGSTRVTVSAATLSSIGVAPAAPSIALGTGVQLTATGTFSDGTTQDLTFQVGWESVDPSVAAVSNATTTRGFATAVRPGQTSISAVLGAVSGSTLLTVTAARLLAVQVTPAQLSLARGSTAPLAAAAIFTDGTSQDVTTQAVWSSATPAIATVSSAPGSQGAVTALEPGSAVVTAALGGVTGSAAITVTAATLVAIELSPSAPLLPQGLTLQLTARGRYTDASTQDLTGQVAWSSSDPTVADVSSLGSSAGTVTGLIPGAVTLTARLGQVSGSTVVAVTPAQLVSLALAPLAPSLPAGLTRQLTATGTFSDGTSKDLTGTVTWSSSAPLVADVSNAAPTEGLVTALAQGSATLTAKFGTVSATTLLTVTSAALVSLSVTTPAATLAKGLTTQLTATGTFTDGSDQELTTQVTWTSSDPAKVVVSNAATSKGLATALAVGSATLTAQLGTVSGTAGLTVTAAELTTLTITGAETELPLGLTRQLTATGRYTDATEVNLTEQVSWASASVAVAEVSNLSGTRGRVAGVAAGSAAISASLGAVVGQVALTVSSAQLSALVVTPAAPSLAKGLSMGLTATGTFTDGTSRDLTGQVAWSSDAPGVATVSNDPATKGRVQALATGSCTLTATFGALSAPAALTVVPAQLVSVGVEFSGLSIPAGLFASFTARGVLTDGSTLDLTTTAVWTTSDPAIALVSNSPGTEGRVTGVLPGPVTITATVGLLAADRTLPIGPAEVVSLTLSPATATLSAGQTQQFLATGTLSDGTTRPLSVECDWTSLDGSVATVSNLESSVGVATAVAPGTTTIRAQYQQLFAPATLTVVP